MEREKNIFRMETSPPAEATDRSADIRTERFVRLGIDTRADDELENPIADTSADLIARIFVGLGGHVPPLGPF
ncbi:MAG: hypothetical protein KGI73_04410 [Patescibacteria group bacterium]|nr:hypothetical protein [Patescibacteria group bacterium]